MTQVECVMNKKLDPKRKVKSFDDKMEKKSQVKLATFALQVLIRVR